MKSPSTSATTKEHLSYTKPIRLTVTLEHNVLHSSRRRNTESKTKFNITPPLEQRKERKIALRFIYQTNMKVATEC